jgi:hypothetical protein
VSVEIQRVQRAIYPINHYITILLKIKNKIQTFRSIRAFLICNKSQRCTLVGNILIITDHLCLQTKVCANGCWILTNPVNRRWVMSLNGLVHTSVCWENLNFKITGDCTTTMKDWKIKTWLVKTFFILLQ